MGTFCSFIQCPGHCLVISFSPRTSSFPWGGVMLGLMAAIAWIRFSYITLSICTIFVCLNFCLIDLIISFPTIYSLFNLVTYSQSYVPVKYRDLDRMRYGSRWKVHAATRSCTAHNAADPAVLTSRHALAWCLLLLVAIRLHKATFWAIGLRFEHDCVNLYCYRLM